jgi:hypothetical protein
MYRDFLLRVTNVAHFLPIWLTPIARALMSLSLPSGTRFTAAVAEEGGGEEVEGDRFGARREGRGNSGAGSSPNSCLTKGSRGEGRPVVDGALDRTPRFGNSG